ncbi:MAG TPA: radical SAM protein [Candidatus Moranbacteria bacterium]|nr:radical SAM protein [Candidatus Moranbacteria bacterium]
MKILLANPPYRVSLNEREERFFIRAGSRWPFSVTKCKNEKSEYMPFPFYLAYTAAMLEKEKEKEEGIEVFVEDSIALNETEEKFLEKVKKINPDVVLFETSTNTIRHDIGLAKKIKEFNGNAKIVMAGFHVTALARETFDISGQAIDFLLLSEYEFNFLELLRTLKRGGECSGLEGIAFKKGDEIIINPVKSLLDISKLPYPARHFFPSNGNNDLSVYWDGFCQTKPAIQMHASRGCPFRCNFCVWNQIMYRNEKYRPFPVNYICDEIESVIKEYGAREIYFDDDTFTGNKEHVLDFCREMIKRGLHKKVFWSAMADFMITDEEMIRTMKKSGCIGLKFGVESGNKDILNHIGKPINFNKLKINTSLCAKLRIKTHGTFTFGLSRETRKTMAETLNLAKSIDCDSVQFSITTPFPGTRYYEELKKEGRLLSEKWEDFDGNNNCVVKFDDFNSEFIVDFYKKATGRWLRHKLKQPRWFWRQLYYLNRSRSWQGNSFIFKRMRRALILVLSR